MTILDTQVFVDPFEDADEQLKKEREDLKTNKPIEKLPKKDAEPPKIYRSGVGKYINPSKTAVKQKTSIDDAPSMSKKQKVISKNLSNFDSW